MNPEREPTTSPEEMIRIRETDRIKRLETIRAELVMSLHLLSEGPINVIQNQLKERVEFSAIAMMEYDPAFEAAKNIMFDKNIETAGWILGHTHALRRTALLRTGEIAAFNMSRAYHDIVDISELDIENILEIHMLLTILEAKYQTA